MAKLEPLIEAVLFDIFMKDGTHQMLRKFKQSNWIYTCSQGKRL